MHEDVDDHAAQGTPPAPIGRRIEATRGWKAAPAMA